MSGIKYQSRLDGLRFVAIFMVLVEHFAYFIGKHISAGFYGVNLFFVISGFLITSILIKNTDGDFKSSYLKFLGRRSLRIFPIYYLTILILWLIGTTGLVDDLPYLLTYTYNYHLENSNSWSDNYSLYWSLSVEEQFYLFFPLIVISLRRRIKILKYTCFFILLVAYSQVFFDVFSLSKYDYVGLLTNMGPLTIGALGAIYLKMGVKNSWVFKSIVAEIIVLIFIFISLTFGNLSLKFLFCSILNLILVLKAYHFSFAITPINKFLANKSLVFTGRVSYGIYVYHGIISFYLTIYLFDPLWKLIPFNRFGIFSIIEFNSWVVKLPFYTLISVGVAYLSYRFIEAPILKLKDRYFGS